MCKLLYSSEFWQIKTHASIWPIPGPVQKGEVHESRKRLNIRKWVQETLGRSWFHVYLQEHCRRKRNSPPHLPATGRYFWGPCAGCRSWCGFYCFLTTMHLENGHPNLVPDHEPGDTFSTSQHSGNRNMYRDTAVGKTFLCLDWQASRKGQTLQKMVAPSSAFRTSWMHLICIQDPPWEGVWRRYILVV